MAKFKIFFIVVFLTAFSAEAGYVRKLREPSFFIPEGEKMHLQEKLPPVRNIQKKVVVKKEESKKEEVTEIPEYKKKYDSYLEDVGIFVKTGDMPQNEALENDLKEMESGEVFEVTQSVVLKETNNKEQEAFYELLKESIEN